MPILAVAVFDVGVVLGLSGLDIQDRNPMFSAHGSSLLLMYSGPLSTLMMWGGPSLSQAHLIHVDKRICPRCPLRSAATMRDLQSMSRCVRLRPDLVEAQIKLGFLVGI